MTNPFKRGAQTLFKHSRGWLELLSRRARYQESAEAVSLIVSALLIGLLAGLAAVAFDRIVYWMGFGVTWLRGDLGGVGGAVVAVLVPAVGGLIITPIVAQWSPDVRGSGIPSVMLSVSNFAGQLPKRILLWRPIASAISIGTGASLGSEGPVVQLSAALASLTSNLMKLNDTRRQSLVAVAAAGGIAATFNAPIAGVLFSLEVMLGKFTNRNFSLVVVGAVAASVVSHAFLGPDPAFSVPNYRLDSPLELPLYLLLGILCAFVGIALIRTVVAVEDAMDRLALPRRWRPAFGGLLIGVMSLAVPSVLGRGYEVTGDILQGGAYSVGLLLLICAAKAVAMSISLAAWHSGGIFGPILLMGAAFGAAFGHLSDAVFPGLAVTPGAFALVGMAAVFAAAERAPMSTIVLVFEMSGDYQLILPLLLAAVMATVVADIFHPESIYHVMLSRKGLSLLRSRESDLLQTVSVREFMEEDIPTLHMSDTVKTLRDTLANSHHHGFILTTEDDPEHIAGIVTLSDLEKARRDAVDPQAPLRQIAHKTVHCALPDEPISDVLERMAGAP